MSEPHLWAGGVRQVDWLELLHKVDLALYNALTEADDYSELRDRVRDIYLTIIPDLPDEEDE